jgi:hypothetical protein
MKNKPQPAAAAEPNEELQNPTSLAAKILETGGIPRD